MSDLYKFASNFCQWKTMMYKSQSYTKSIHLAQGSWCFGAVSVDTVDSAWAGSKGRILNSVHCGFHPGWKYVDHLYTLSRVVEGAWEFAQPVHSSFVDLRRACNLVPQWVPLECDTAVWSTLHASTVPLYILYALCSLSTGVRAWLDTTSKELDLFPGNGWTLPGLHFGIFMGKNVLHTARLLRGSCGLHLVMSSNSF